MGSARLLLTKILRLAPGCPPPDKRWPLRPSDQDHPGEYPAPDRRARAHLGIVEASHKSTLYRSGAPSYRIESETLLQVDNALIPFSLAPVHGAQGPSDLTVTWR